MQRIELLDKIYASSLTLLDTETPQEAYKVITEEAIKLVSALYGTIFIGEGGALKRVYSTVPEAYWLEPRKNGNTYSTYRTGKPRIIEQAELVKVHPEFHKHAQTMIFIPLFYQNKPTGVLNLQLTRKATEFSQADLNTLQVYGAFASLAIRKNTLNTNLEEALKVRDYFISMASHELRTPLTVIKLYTQLILETMNSKRTIKKQWTEHLADAVSRLVHLADELLTLDRVKRGELEFNQAPFPVEEALLQAMHECKLTFPHHQFDYVKKRKGSDIVTADKGKITQAFINIFNNAAKYSPPESRIVTTLVPYKHVVKISIADQGMGIPSEILPYVFNEFYRGTKTHRDGIGLGLALVKKIIENNHGKITIRSRPNKGTTVLITLPQMQKYLWQDQNKTQPITR